MRENWPVASIGSCCDILDHLRVPLNSEERLGIQGNVPYYGANGLQGYIDKFIFDEPLILIAEDGGYFDEYQTRPIAYRVYGKSWVNNHAHILRAQTEAGVVQDFLFYCLEHKNITPFIKGGTRAKLNQSELRQVAIPKPPKPQQQRIAEILTTVDEAIEQTEALIAKTQQVKAGLMHDLFTRGVTPNGQLRPPRPEAPQLYKNSPLGWIPKEWECLTIDELLARTACPMRSGPFGSALLKEELIEDGLPLLGIDNVLAERFVGEFRRFVATQKFAELNRYAVFPKDVIITIMGTVGRCCVVPDEIAKALSSKHLWTMTFDKIRVLPDLVCWQLNYAPWVKAWFARHSQGAVMDAIQSSTLRTLKLPVPPMDEQMLLHERYVAFSARLSTENEHLQELMQLKLGLMHDLLTGRVRVPEKGAS